MVDGGLLILGLGNILCGDDGLGIAAVARLRRRYAAPIGASILDGGTLGLSLLPLLRQARDVILVDAIAADGPVGAEVRLEGGDVAPAIEQRISPHQVGVVDLLEGARLLDGPYGETRRIILLGLSPATLELGTTLTPAVAAGLDGLVAAGVEQAAAWGTPLVERPSPAEGELDDVALVLGL